MLQKIHQSINDNLILRSILITYIISQSNISNENNHKLLITFGRLLACLLTPLTKLLTQKKTQNQRKLYCNRRKL